MNHADIQDKLFEAYDSELPAETLAALTAHLDACVECRGRLDDWRMTAQKILQPLRAPASELFVQNVMRGVRTQDTERPPLFARWAFPALALSMAGFALTFLYIEHATPAVSDTPLWVDQDTAAVSTALPATPTEDQILNAAVQL